jgi:aldehyde dehydrogenase (NAD+)
MVESRSPQDPANILVCVPDVGPEEVARAAARARAAAAEWAAAPASIRGNALVGAAAALESRGDELTDLIVAEVGKPRAEARAEVSRAVSVLRYFSQEALQPEGSTLPSGDGRSLLLTLRRPHGVAGLITPWNFPLAIPAWKMAPALAYGNAVLHKPSPESTAVALRLDELLRSSLPAGLVHTLPGSARTGQAVVEHADCLSFTGSAAVGRELAVAAARRGIPVQTEMGGLNASIVLDDANLDRAAPLIAASAMGYAGQKCTATSRVLIVGDASRLTEVRDAVVDAVAQLRFGDPSADDAVVGPVINRAAQENVQDALSEAISAGGNVLVGGSGGSHHGWYVSPAVVADAPATCRLAREEVFGPVCTLQGVDRVEAAIAASNATPYGLVTSIYTENIGAALTALQQLETGLIRVNQPTSGVDFWAPFGGDKASSYGPREQGKAAREFYTKTHTCNVAALR